MKILTRKLTKGIYIAYSLTKENSEYTISCIQENKIENKTTFYRVDNITPSRARAKKIYNLVVKHRAFGETLIDVIGNLIVES